MKISKIYIIYYCMGIAKKYLSQCAEPNGVCQYTFVPDDYVAPFCS